MRISYLKNKEYIHILVPYCQIGTHQSSLDVTPWLMLTPQHINLLFIHLLELGSTLHRTVKKFKLYCFNVFHEKMKSIFICHFVNLLLSAYQSLVIGLLIKCICMFSSCFYSNQEFFFMSFLGHCCIDLKIVINFIVHRIYLLFCRNGRLGYQTFSRRVYITTL